MRKPARILTVTVGLFNGQPIPGLYCGGESAGGCSQHGQGRAITQGYIAGREAANEKSST
jgi:succinate dehydrogenase/fumarate reductase flavoprotein subunit